MTTSKVRLLAEQHPPKVVERAAQIEAERDALRCAERDEARAVDPAIQEWVRRTVDAAPPISDEGWRYLSRLLRPTAEQQEQEERQAREDIAEARRQLKAERQSSSIADRLSTYAGPDDAEETP